MIAVMIRFLPLILILSSCSILPERYRQREIQTEIISKMTEKSPEFSKCIETNQLFTKFNTKRVRIVIFLSIDSRGQIEKFKLDQKKYPNEFSECIFTTLDTVSFPKIKNHELIELEQPFIFSAK